MSAEDTPRILRFSEILGQPSVLAMLREAIATSTLHHALLFVGPEGVGKRTTARSLAARLLCESPRDDDACGLCGACRQVAVGSHPDFHREGLLPADDKSDSKKKILRADMLLEQAHRIQHFLGGRALAGGRKVAIIEDAHALNLEAQNALLKTLEEPPRSSLVVLVCHNVSRLESTVRSRCQRVAFAPLDRATVEGVLEGRLGCSAEDARLIAAYSQGSLAFAADVDSLRAAHERVTRLLAASGTRSYPEVVAAAQAILTSTKGVPLELNLVVAMLRSELRARAGMAEPEELTPSGKTGTLVDALRATEAAYAAVLELGRYANRRLAAERMWLRIGESN